MARRRHSRPITCRAWPRCSELPPAKVAIFSLSSNWRSDTFYLVQSLVLGWSLHRFAKRVPRYIFFPETETPTLAAVARLRGAGWRTCGVRRIEPAPSAGAATGARSRWPAGYSKFVIFGLVQFERVLLLDADMLAVRSLTPLLTYPMHGARLGATPDLHAKWSSLVRDPWTFNGGMLLLRPNATLAAALLRFVEPTGRERSDDQQIARRYGSGWSEGESPMLIEFMRRLRVPRVKLPWSYNLPTAMLGRPQLREAFREAQPVHLVHFTMGKPPAGCEGACSASPLYKYALPCAWWNATRRAFEAAAAGRVDTMVRDAGSSSSGGGGGGGTGLAARGEVNLTRACEAVFAPLDVDAFDGPGDAEPPVSLETMPQGNASMHGARSWPGCTASLAAR